MSLVDRWLLRQVANTETATVATSATPQKEARISATPDVSDRLRRAATSAPAATPSLILSQAVADRLRQERALNSAVSEGVSQLSQMSQRAGSAAWGDSEEERAAIIEHDGKILRSWAEGFARLDPDRPPKDVPPKRWLQFINHIGWFLDSPFCAVAAALGWTAFDLFGADRDRPFARIDYAGLLWLLNGNRLAMLAENTATIETRTGARQTYRLKPSAPGRVLAWELVDGEPPDITGGDESDAGGSD
jgi:hypothetical protein